jgi:hypothetical protein
MYDDSMSKLTVCFAALCMLASPALAEPVTPAAQVEKGPMRKPATDGELEQYAQRERVAEKLAHFEGGRSRAIDAGTLVVILLIVIIIILIV